MSIDALRRLCAADRDPAIPDAELWEILDLCRRRDASGLGPSDAGWHPTYDMELAAAMAWESKAAAVASEFDVTADGAAMARSQMQAQFLARAALHRRRVVGRAT